MAGAILFRSDVVLPDVNRQPQTSGFASSHRRAKRRYRRPFVNGPHPQFEVILGGEHVDCQSRTPTSLAVLPPLDSGRQVGTTATFAATSGTPAISQDLRLPALPSPVRRVLAVRGDGLPAVSRRLRLKKQPSPAGGRTCSHSIVCRPTASDGRRRPQRAGESALAVGVESGADVDHDKNCALGGVAVRRHSKRVDLDSELSGYLAAVDPTLPTNHASICREDCTIACDKHAQMLRSVAAYRRESESTVRRKCRHRAARWKQMRMQRKRSQATLVPSQENQQHAHQHITGGRWQTSSPTVEVQQQQKEEDSASNEHSADSIVQSPRGAENLRFQTVRRVLMLRLRSSKHVVDSSNASQRERLENIPVEEVFILEDAYRLLGSGREHEGLHSSGLREAINEVGLSGISLAERSKVIKAWRLAVHQASSSLVRDREGNGDVDDSETHLDCSETGDVVHFFTFAVVVVPLLRSVIANVRDLELRKKFNHSSRDGLLTFDKCCEVVSDIAHEPIEKSLIEERFHDILRHEKADHGRGLNLAQLHRLVERVCEKAQRKLSGTEREIQKKYGVPTDRFRSMRSDLIILERLFEKHSNRVDVSNRRLSESGLSSLLLEFGLRPCPRFSSMPSNGIEFNCLLDLVAEMRNASASRVLAELPEPFEGTCLEVLNYLKQNGRGPALLLDDYTLECAITATLVNIANDDGIFTTTDTAQALERARELTRRTI